MYYLVVIENLIHPNRVGDGWIFRKESKSRKGINKEIRRELVCEWFNTYGLKNNSTHSLIYKRSVLKEQNIFYASKVTCIVKNNDNGKWSFLRLQTDEFLSYHVINSLATNMDTVVLPIVYDDVRLIEFLT